MQTTVGINNPWMFYHSIDEDFRTSPIRETLEQHIEDMCRRTYLFSPCEILVGLDGKVLCNHPAVGQSHYQLKTEVDTDGGDYCQNIFTICLDGVQVGFGSIEE